MNKLIRKTVYKILDENENARKDDNYLIFKVVQALEPELSRTAFANVMFNLKYKNISFEGITRARRKYFEEYPERNTLLNMRKNIRRLRWITTIEF